MCWNEKDRHTYNNIGPPKWCWQGEHKHCGQLHTCLQLGVGNVWGKALVVRDEFPSCAISELSGKKRAAFSLQLNKCELEPKAYTSIQHPCMYKPTVWSLHSMCISQDVFTPVTVT